MAGLSPLARGNLNANAGCANNVGPIPARTGQPKRAVYYRIVWGAYPRSHGATVNEALKSIGVEGLSPLARGNLIQAVLARNFTGPIPARTGQPVQYIHYYEYPRAYPRSHGATEEHERYVEKIEGLSPLARGNPATTVKKVAGKGPIPARTGQPLWMDSMAAAQRAYPRSHGATAACAGLVLCPWGLSPLARGNRAPFSSKY